MATIRAIASGNFSSGSIWNGGIVPSTGDEAVASGNTITISGNITTISLRNDTAGGATAGGTFILANGATMNTTGTTGLFVATSNATPVLQFNLPSGSSATYNGNNATFNGNGLAGGSGGSKLILYQNTGTFYINGNFNMNGSSSNVHKYSIQIAGTGRVEILGDLTSTVTAANNPTVPLYITAVATVIINALNITGGGTNNNVSAAIYSAAAANLDITCPTIQGGNSPAIHMFGGGTYNILTTNVIGGGGIFPAIGNITLGAAITITGAVTAGTTSNGITSLSSVTVTGNVTAGTNANGISTTGLVSVDGLIENTSQFQGVYSPRILIGASTTSIRYQTSLGATQLMYLGTSGVSGQPTTNNVRFGTPFGVDDTFVGTCRIPTPDTVLLGAPTDDTTGTLLMTPDQFVSELNTSGTPVAVRIRNVSTVETTGDQIVSYNV